MSISFSELIAPTELTTGLAILIAVILGLIAYLGFRLRHGVILLFWGISLVVLMLTILIDIPFVLFWGVILIDGIFISFAGLYRYVIEPMSVT